MIFRRESGNPFFGILIVLFLFMMVWFAITAVRGIFMLLSWLALPLFILALVLNHKVVVEYVSWLWRMIKRDTVKGLVFTGLSLVGYPFVSAYLAFKALSNYRLKNSDEDDLKGEYIKYREVKVTDEDDDEDFLELPELDVVKKERNEVDGSNNYDDMF